MIVVFFIWSILFLAAGIWLGYEIGYYRALFGKRHYTLDR